MATTKRKTKKPTSRKATRKPATRKKVVRRPRRVVKNVAPVLFQSRPGFPRIGDTMPEQGGKFAGVFRGADGKEYGLVVAVGAEGLLRGAWGEYGKTVKGADNRIDGRANTQAMADAGSKLAKDAMAVKTGGKSDWYIPSQRELMLCFVNVPDLFDPHYHWSSTQYSAYFAWGQDFDDGHANIDNKDYEDRCRLVRSFPL